MLLLTETNRKWTAETMVASNSSGSATGCCNSQLLLLHYVC